MTNSSYDAVKRGLHLLMSLDLQRCVCACACVRERGRPAGAINSGIYISVLCLKRPLCLQEERSENENIAQIY